MATVLDEKIKAVVDSHGWFKTLLGVLLAGLSFRKGRGWFEKGQGPQ